MNQPNKPKDKQTNNQETNTQSSKSSANTHRNFLARHQKLSIAFVGFILLIFGGVALLPTLLSSTVGRKMIINLANDQIPGQIEIDDISLNWTAGQSIRGIRIKDATGRDLLRIDQIDAPAISLMNIGRGQMNFGKVTISGITGTITQKNNGQLDLAEVFVAATQKEEPAPLAKHSQPTKPITFNGELDIRDTNLTIKTAAGQVLEIKQGQAQLTATDSTQITANISANIAEGQKQGSIHAKIKIDDLLKADGSFNQKNATVDIDAQFKKIPTALIQTFAALNIDLAPIVGNELSATIYAKGTLKKGIANIHLAGGQLLSLNLKLDVSEQLISLNPQSEIRWTITPKGWQTIQALQGNHQASKLLKPATLASKKLAMTLPRNGEKIRLDQATFEAVFTMDDLLIDTQDAAIGQVALKQTNFAAKSQSLQKNIQLSFNALAQQNKNTGHITANIRIENPLTETLAPHFSAMKIKANGSLKNFSLALVDQLANTHGLIAASFGKQLNTIFEANLYFPNQTLMPAGTIDLVSQADYFQTHIGINIDAKKITIKPQSNIVFNIQPALINQLLHHPGNPRSNSKSHEKNNITSTNTANPQLAPTGKLLSPVTAKFVFNRFILPTNATSINLANLAIEGQLNIGDLQWDTGNALGKFALQQTSLKVQTNQLAKQLNFTLASKAKQRNQQGQLQIAMQLNNLFTDTGVLNLKNISAKPEIKLTNWPVAMLDTFAQTKGLLTTVLGPILNVTLAANISPSPNTNELSGDLKLTAQTDYLKVNLQGSLANGFWQSNKHSNLAYQITPSMLDQISAILAIDLNATKLRKPANFYFKFPALKIPINGASLNDAIFSITGTIDQIALANTGNIHNASVEQISINLKETSLDGPLNFQLGAILKQANDQGKISLAARIDKPLLPSRIIDTNITLNSVPVSWLDAFAQQHGLLAKILGDKISTLAASVQIAPDKPLIFTSKIKSPHLAANLAGHFNAGKRIVFKPASTIDFELTPASYQALMNRSVIAPNTPTTAAKNSRRNNQKPSKNKPSKTRERLKLIAPVKIKLAINQCDMPLNFSPNATASDNNNKPNNSSNNTPLLNIYLTASPIRLAHSSFEYAKFDRSELTIQTTPSRGLVLDSSTNLTVQLSKSQQALHDTFKLSLNISPLFNQAGQVDLTKAKIAASVHAEHLPIDVLDAQFDIASMIGFTGPISDVFGKTMRVNLEIKDDTIHPSVIHLFVKSAQLQSSLDAQIIGGLPRPGVQSSQQRVMRLLKPSVTTLIPTAALGREILAKVNPVFSDVQTTTEPIELTISKETFALPLNPVDLKTANADIHLKLGKLTAKSKGFLARLMSLLRQNPRSVEIQVTPFNAHLAKGILTYSYYYLNGRPELRDMVATLNGLELGFRGKVDLIKKRLNMDIAIYHSAIAAAYPQVKAMLNPDDAIVIKMVGPMANPKLNEAALAREILRITASRATGLLDNKQTAPAAALLNSLLGGSNANARRSPEAQRRREAAKRDAKKQAQQQKTSPSTSSTNNNQAAPLQPESNAKAKTPTRKLTPKERRRERRRKQIEEGAKLLQGLFGN